MNKQMRKSRFVDTRFVGLTNVQEAGMPTAQVCRKHGLCQGKFLPRFGATEVSGVAKLSALEDKPPGSSTCRRKQC